METAKIDRLKKIYKLKKEAKGIYEFEFGNSDKPYGELEAIVNALYESYQNGENVSIETFVPGKSTVPYKIYSCDIEGKTKEQFFEEQKRVYDNIDKATEIMRHNGSHGLPQEMLKTLKNGDNKLYIYRGHNGISIVFSSDDLTGRTDEDFLDYATIVMEGRTVKEAEQEEASRAAREEERAKRHEEIKSEMTIWIEEGSLLISPEKVDEWKSYIESYQGDSIAYAPIIGQALEIMKCLEENNSIEDTIQILNTQGHSGGTKSEVINIVTKFSKRGQEFSEHISRIEESEWNMQINDTISEVTEIEVDSATKGVKSIALGDDEKTKNPDITDDKEEK